MNQENPLNLKDIKDAIQKGAELFAQEHNLGCLPETLDCLPACGVLTYAINKLKEEANKKPDHPSTKGAFLLEALKNSNLAKQEPYQAIVLLTQTKLLPLIELITNGAGNF